MVIQFICRGNAFRSIIAEAYLRSLPIPGLTILSSGTVASKYRDENHVNFSKTRALLKSHGIEQFAKDHYADDVKQNVLDGSDIVIFLNRIAYQEAASLFQLPKRTHVWDVTDLDEEGRVATTDAERESYSEDIYEEIAKNVDKLVNDDTLRGKQFSSHRTSYEK